MVNVADGDDGDDDEIAMLIRTVSESPSLKRLALKINGCFQSSSFSEFPSLLNLKEIKVSTRINRDECPVDLTIPITVLLSKSTNLHTFELSAWNLQMDVLCEALADNRILKALTVHAWENYRDISKRLAALMREHNSTLETVEVKDFKGQTIHDEELEYLCQLNICGRWKVRSSEVSAPDFVNLLTSVQDNADVSGRDLLVTSLLYGLLREKPHFWCLV
jgi:hypothetical protein